MVIIMSVTREDYYNSIRRPLRNRGPVLVRMHSISGLRSYAYTQEERVHVTYGAAHAVDGYHYH
jgi:hypothetical protein